MLRPFRAQNFEIFLPRAGMLRPFRAQNFEIFLPRTFPELACYALSGLRNALKLLNEIKCNFFVLHPFTFKIMFFQSTKYVSQQN